MTATGFGCGFFVCFRERFLGSYQSIGDVLNETHLGLIRLIFLRWCRHGSML